MIHFFDHLASKTLSVSKNPSKNQEKNQKIPLQQFKKAKKAEFSLSVSLATDESPSLQATLNPTLPNYQLASHTADGFVHL